MITESDSGISGSRSHDEASQSARQRLAAEYVDSDTRRPEKARKAPEPDMLDFSADDDDDTAGSADLGEKKPGDKSTVLTDREEIELIKSEWRRSLRKPRTVDVAKEREAFDQALSELNPSKEQSDRITKNIQEMTDRLRKRGIPEKELGLTLQQATRLLTADKIQVPESERVNLVEQIFKHAASSESIDQGLFSTCGLSTMEKHMFALMPSKAAEIVATTAITGGFQRQGGKRVTIDAGSLAPDHEAANNNPPRDGSRDYASQLFSLAVTNDYWQQQKEPRSYKLVDDGHGGKVERLIDLNGKEVSENGQVINNPSLSEHQLIEEAELLMKADYPLLVRRDPQSLSMQIDSPERLAKMIARLEERGELPVNLVVPKGNSVLNTDATSIFQISGFDGAEAVAIRDMNGVIKSVKLNDLVRSMPGLNLAEFTDKSKPDGTFYGFDATHPEERHDEPNFFFSENEMRNELVSAIDSGKWPVTLKVNAGDPIFRNAVSASATDFTHVLSISAYRDSGNELEFFVDNQWGLKNDRWIKMSELYRATNTG